MPKIIGIDLGTTNSEAAVMQGGQPKVIPSAIARLPVSARPSVHRPHSA